MSSASGTLSSLLIFRDHFVVRVELSFPQQTVLIAEETLEGVAMTPRAQEQSLGEVGRLSNDHWAAGDM